MKIGSAVALEVGELKSPIITGYQLGLIIFRLYTEKKYKGEKLSYLRRDAPQRGNYTRLINELMAFGILKHDHLVSHREIFSVLSQSTPSAEEIACCVDPFSYVSHLSAMEYHGLTDRFPKMLFLSSPTASNWTQLAKKKMEKDLGEFLDRYGETGFPKLKRLNVRKISKKIVSVHNSVHYTSGAYVNVKGHSLRVSSIGRTFLDMISNPSLCGGIYHVLDIYKEFAKRYLRLIVDETDRHGSVIDKTRIGYVLNERLGLSDPRIETWKNGVQRGGSRKLVAENPYVPVFSEKWCLSLNIEESSE